MTAPAKRQVVIRPDEGGYVVALEPFGETRTLRTYCSALRHAECTASDASCALIDLSGWQPVAGDLGPIAYINSPRAVVAREPDGCWVVCVVRPPWGSRNLGREFWGADSEAKARRYANRLVATFKTMAEAAVDARTRKVELRKVESLGAKGMAR